MVIHFKKACLVLAAVAVLAISFPAASYSEAPKGINCAQVKDSVGKMYGMGAVALVIPKMSETDQMELFKSQTALAANLATIYDAFRKD